MIFEHNFLTFNVDGFPKFGGISHPGKFNGKPKFGRQISAHLHRVTGANERNSCEITETGPDMDGKRSRWGCPCYSLFDEYWSLGETKPKHAIFSTAVELEWFEDGSDIFW